MTSPTSTPMAMPALADRLVITRARARCPAPSSVATSDWPAMPTASSMFNPKFQAELTPW